jgi:hypothetical protein
MGGRALQLEFARWLRDYRGRPRDAERLLRALSVVFEQKAR